MSSLNICNWLGASGKTYLYYIYPWPTTFADGQHGNYIYAKIVKNNWEPLYIGEGDLGKHVSKKHRKAQCIASKGATYVHVRINDNGPERVSEANDLLVKFVQAYEPFGCNEKPKILKEK